VVDPGATVPYRFGDLLALARRSWVRQITHALEQAGYAGYRLSDAWLLRLLTDQPLPVGRLGEAMGVTRQAARKLAGGLAERGYAALTADPADGRRTLVTLTEAGQVYARVVADAQHVMNTAIADRVRPADLAIADSVLRAVFPSAEARQRISESVPPP
jgi:DNA-binding MarR family transcriptional regulator